MHLLKMIPILSKICCYAPTEDDSDSFKNTLYSNLRKQFKFEKSKKILCLGDFMLLPLQLGITHPYERK